ncbi:hypothetical protein TorRG33x02_221630, partial [Trema orientale]
DHGRVGGLLGRGNALDPEGAVRDAPLLDESPERVVRDEGEVGERDSGDRARGVPGCHPGLDAGPVVGLAGAHRYRVTHQLKRDRAPEMVRNLDTQIQRL